MISILIRASAETLARVAEQARARGCEITVRGKRGRLHTAVLTCTALDAQYVYDASGARNLREDGLARIEHDEACERWLPPDVSTCSRCGVEFTGAACTRCP